MTSSTLKQLVAGLAFLTLPALGWAGQNPPAPFPFAGEYFCTRNANPICVPYTKNLNQFRRLDFDVCHPRLSDKYPQFTRPGWEEISFDLEMARRTVDNLSWFPENRETVWQEWLKASEPLRKEGKIKFWRTRIDIDNDGVVETIIRLDNPFSTKYWQGKMSWTVEPDACDYRHSTLYMLDSPNDSMKNGFNRQASTVTDIFHSSGGQVHPGESKGYYAVGRLTLPTEPEGRLIGANRGMKVYQLNNWGAGEVCDINWVPTGAYRPLKRPRSPR